MDHWQVEKNIHVLLTSYWYCSNIFIPLFFFLMNEDAYQLVVLGGIQDPGNDGDKLG